MKFLISKINSTPVHVFQPAWLQRTKEVLDIAPSLQLGPIPGSVRLIYKKQDETHQFSLRSEPVMIYPLAVDDPAEMGKPLGGPSGRTYGIIFGEGAASVITSITPKDEDPNEDFTVYQYAEIEEYNQLQLEDGMDREHVAKKQMLG